PGLSGPGDREYPRRRRRWNRGGVPRATAAVVPPNQPDETLNGSFGEEESAPHAVTQPKSQGQLGVMRREGPTNVVSPSCARPCDRQTPGWWSARISRALGAP